MRSEHRPLPPLDFLRGFEAAARHLSFTKAASELFVTQSAVSRQIQALEEFIGVPLFERRHKSLALTEAGHAYYRTVAPVLEQLRDATRRLRETRNANVLTVTTTVSFASLWLVPRLARFRQKHPSVDVRITASPDIVDIERERIDVAIRDIAVDRAPPGSQLLVREQIAAVCSTGYIRESRREKRPLARPADLRHHVLLHMHDPMGRYPYLSWRPWLEAMGLSDLEPAGALTFNQYDQVIQAALLGQGVALGRMTVAGDLVRKRKLVILFGSRQKLERAFHAVFSQAARARPEAQRFVEWIREELASGS